MRPRDIPLSEQTVAMLQAIGKALHRHRVDDLKEHDPDEFARNRLWGRRRRSVANIESGKMTRLSVGEFLEVVGSYGLTLDGLISLLLEGAPETVHLDHPEKALKDATAELLTWGTPAGRQLEYVNYSSPDLGQFNVSISSATLSKGKSTAGLIPDSHLGEEVLLVTQGELEVEVASHKRNVGAGEILVFKSRHPHFARDVTGKTSKYVVVRMRCRAPFPATPEENPEPEGQQ